MADIPAVEERRASLLSSASSRVNAALAWRMMNGRYALLDDNQHLLEDRLAALGALLPLLVSGHVAAIMVIGSVSEGRAGDESDIDLVLVLRSGLPRRSDYTWWETDVAPRLPESMRQRFPIQTLFLGRAALGTSEPNLRRALSRGLIVWDPEGLFVDQSESRA